MHEDEQLTDYGGTAPFYYQLCASAWRSFIMHRYDKCDLDSEKRLMSAAEKVYRDLEQSDKELLSFYGYGHGLPNDALAGYSYEKNISRSEIRTRFNWLCYRLAVEAGIINRFSWLPPPEHFIDERKKRI